jgi:hypothetical protein
MKSLNPLLLTVAVLAAYPSGVNAAEFSPRLKLKGLRSFREKAVSVFYVSASEAFVTTRNGAQPPGTIFSVHGRADRRDGQPLIISEQGEVEIPKTEWTQIMPAPVGSHVLNHVIVLIHERPTDLSQREWLPSYRADGRCPTVPTTLSYNPNQGCIPNQFNHARPGVFMFDSQLIGDDFTIDFAVIFPGGVVPFQ